jgi:hypothetical protein
MRCRAFQERTKIKQGTIKSAIGLRDETGRPTQCDHFLPLLIAMLPFLICIEQTATLDFSVFGKARS